MNHPRDSRIALDKVKHTYTVDGQNGYTGVSAFKRKWFLCWFNPEADQTPDTEETLQRQALRDEKRDKGIELHDWIEKFYAHPEDGNCVTNEDFVKRYFKYIEKDDMLPSDLPTTDKAWYHFIKFAIANKHWHLVRSEWQVFNEKYKLAGMLDVIFKIPMPDGTFRTVLCDWKRISRIWYHSQNLMGCPRLIPHITYPASNYWDYHVQLNLYRIIVEDCYNMKIDYMLIIRLSEQCDNFHIFIVERDERLREMLAMDCESLL